MNINGIEIERKYLIAMPDAAFLDNCERSEITQTYLRGDAYTTERVRKRVRGDTCEYTHTLKRKLNNMRRIEDEHVIGEEEYKRLLERADPARNTILKTRHCFEYDGRIWELDVFSFWDDRAFLEIELTDEGDAVTLPPEIRLIREVTDDPRYTNAALSLEIPQEDMIAVSLAP
jgi:CYTH domain-containing protein